MKQADQRVVRHICRRVGCHAITATVLANRGFEREEDISTFLYPSIAKIDSFFSLKDMDCAVIRIAAALEKNEKIIVFGDYDVDGITASTIVRWFLKKAGADAEIYIPHRIDEGYGLKTAHVADVFLPAKTDLVITVDCGSGSAEAVRVAKAAGIGVIVTDHHDIDELPEADAVVNPKRPDCNAGLEHLAGVGVAFYLLVCLRKHLRDTGHWEKYPEPNLKEICDLVALGTIADVVPLIRENRTLVKAGMGVINTAPRCGIKALIEACGIKNPIIETEDLAFRLAPRLNAAGRLDHAMTAANLLGTEDIDEAVHLASIVNTLNGERQNIEATLQQQILAYLAQENELERYKAIVLADKDWHQGVLGIVASRLAEKFSRPVILFTINGEMSVGSARSIPGIDLHESLLQCAPLLESFGGHAMAAGLRVAGTNLKKFKQAFDACITQDYPKSAFVQELEIDCMLNFDMISEKVADEILLLAPFGEKNPEPLFSAENVTVKYSRIVGRKHMQMSLAQTGSKTGKIVPAIMFNVDPEKNLPTDFERITYRLQWNHYNGSRKLQIIVEAVNGAW